MIRIPPVLTEPHLTLASGALHAAAEAAQLAQPNPR
jgi:hypothetical protein